MQQDTQNSDLVRDYHIFSFPYYYLKDLLPKVAPQLMEFHSQRDSLSHPYFQNKELKVWPKVQIPILLELLAVCYEDTAL